MTRDKHSGKVRLTVTDPDEITFLTLIRGMNRQQRATVEEVLRVTDDREPLDVVRAALLRCVYALGISEADVGELLDKFMQHLADERRQMN